MKRFLVGCLAVVAVLSVVGGVLAYAFVVRPLRQAWSGAQELSRIAALNEQVENRRGFAAPKGQEMSPSQVERFLAVQQQIRNGLENRFEDLAARYDEAQGREPKTFPELVRAYGDLARLVVQAKEIQVRALNEQGFSLGEYAWVKAQVLAAAGFPVKPLDWGEIASGQEPRPEMVFFSGPVPEANRVLVEPYRRRLEPTLALAYFGL